MRPPEVTAASHQEVARRTPWLGALVILDVAVVTAWVLLLLSDGPVGPLDTGQPLYLLPPATFMLLGATGILSLLRLGRHHRRSAVGVSLWISSALVLSPLVLYAWLEYLFFALRDF